MIAQKYLWMGISGRWALEYGNAKIARNASIDSVRYCLRVVTPSTPKVKQIKFYALMGVSDMKTPCVIRNDLCFYFNLEGRTADGVRAGN